MEVGLRDADDGETVVVDEQAFVPTTAGSAANRLVQYAWLSTTTGSGLAAVSSPGSITRPRAAVTPNVRKVGAGHELARDTFACARPR